MGGITSNKNWKPIELQVRGKRMNNSYDKLIGFYANNIICQTPEIKNKQEYQIQGQQYNIYKCMHCFITKENLYDINVVIAWRFLLVIKKVRNTEDSVSIPVQRKLEFFYVIIAHQLWQPSATSIYKLMCTSVRQMC